MENLYEKKVVCLYCGNPFTTLKARQNRVRIKSRDTDFYTVYEGTDPTLYDFFTCPSCGFSFTSSFSPLLPAKKALIQTKYISKMDKINLCGVRTPADALKGYKLTLICATILEEKKLILANLCLRIAWIYRSLNQPEEEQRFLSYAVREYEEVYQSESLDKTSMEEGKLIYLIGELHSRLNHYDATRKWFSFLFTAKHIDAKWKKIGRDRWLDIKSQQASIKEDPEGY